MLSFDDYIVYVDESGDHSLTSIDRQPPIFVLAFRLFCWVDAFLFGPAAGAEESIRFRYRFLRALNNIPTSHADHHASEGASGAVERDHR